MQIGSATQTRNLPQENNPQIEDLIERANELHKKRETSRAIEILKEGLGRAATPSLRAKLFQMLGIAFLAIGNTLNALEAIRSGLAIEHEDIQLKAALLFGQAKCYEKQNDLKKGIQSILAALYLEPASCRLKALLYLALANCRYKQGDMEDAKGAIFGAFALDLADINLKAALFEMLATILNKEGKALEASKAAYSGLQLGEINVTIRNRLECQLNYKRFKRVFDKSLSQ